MSYGSNLLIFIIFNFLGCLPLSVIFAMRVDLDLSKAGHWFEVSDHTLGTKGHVCGQGQTLFKFRKLHELHCVSQEWSGVVDFVPQNNRLSTFRFSH